MRNAPHLVWTVAVVASLALAASGCDLLGPGGTSAEGVVVDAETGAPIQDVWVTLRFGGGGFAGPNVIASDSTASDGTFLGRRVGKTSG